MWQKAEDVFVLAGDHTPTVMLREDSAAIDEILITDDPTFVPSGEGGY